MKTLEKLEQRGAPRLLSNDLMSYFGGGTGRTWTDVSEDHSSCTKTTTTWTKTDNADGSSCYSYTEKKEPML